MADLTYVGDLTVPGSMFLSALPCIRPAGGSCGSARKHGASLVAAFFCAATHDRIGCFCSGSDLDETNLYSPVLHAGHDQCTGCGQTL